MSTRTGSASIDKVGQVKADCRKKKQDDEERKRLLVQMTLSSSSVGTNSPGLSSGTSNTSGGTTSSLREITIPSYVSEDDFHCPIRLFALNVSEDTDRVMVDSGAYSACPPDYANEHAVCKFNTRSIFKRPAELLEHQGEKLVPYMVQDTIMGITHQVPDVEGPDAAVSSMNDGGMTVVFSPEGAWVCDETKLKPTGSIDLKRENRTFWIDLPEYNT